MNDFLEQNTEMQYILKNETLKVVINIERFQFCKLFHYPFISISQIEEFSSQRRKTSWYDDDAW